MNILDPLLIPDKLDCFGFSMQGLYGDNNTPKPNVFNLIETLKWNNWTDKKGMSMDDAKR